MRITTLFLSIVISLVLVDCKSKESSSEDSTNLLLLAALGSSTQVTCTTANLLNPVTTTNQTLTFRAGSGAGVSGVYAYGVASITGGQTLVFTSTTTNLTQTFNFYLTAGTDCSAATGTQLNWTATAPTATSYTFTPGTTGNLLVKAQFPSLTTPPTDVQLRKQ